jgi:predicted DNA-binding transcriptional regulator AlpA
MGQSPYEEKGRQNGIAAVEQIYSIREAARMCGGIHVSSMYRLIRSGRIAAPVRISPGRVGLRASDVEAFLSSLESAR